MTPLLTHFLFPEAIANQITHIYINADQNYVNYLVTSIYSNRCCL